MFLANVPFTHWAWLAVALLTMFVVGGVVFNEVGHLFGKGSFIVDGFLVLISVQWALVVLACVSVAARRFYRARQSPDKRGKSLNDGVKQDHMFAYAHWLVNARRPPHDNPEKRRARKNREMEQGWRMTLQTVLRDRLRVLVDPFVLPVSIYDRQPLPPLQPPDDIVAASVPVKFHIILAVLLVLYVVLWLFTIYIVERMNLYGQDILNVLPKVTIADVPRTRQAISDLVSFASRRLPQLSFLEKLVFPIIHSSFFELVFHTTTLLTQMVAVGPYAVAIAHALAGSLLLFHIVQIYRNIPGLILQARRGELRSILMQQKPFGNRLNADKANAYIGVHCVLFTLHHQTIFWATFAVATLLGSPLIFDFLWRALWTLVKLTASVTVVKKFLMVTVVRHWAAEGFWVHNTFLFSIWSIVTVVLGIFSGLVSAVLRTLKTLSALFFGFSRVDVGLFPYEHRLRDRGFVMFYSMILFEARYNNPVLLSVVATLLIESRCAALLRALPEDLSPPAVSGSAAVAAAGDFDGSQRRHPTLARASVFTAMDEAQTEAARRGDVHDTGATTLIGATSFDLVCRLPAMRSMVRAVTSFRMLEAERYHARFGDHVLGDGHDATGLDSDFTWDAQHATPIGVPVAALRRQSARYSRVARRFWLLVLLHRNPSLRPWRKHAILAERHGGGLSAFDVELEAFAPSGAGPAYKHPTDFANL